MLSQQRQEINYTGLSSVRFESAKAPIRRVMRALGKFPRSARETVGVDGYLHIQERRQLKEKIDMGLHVP
jgi:hypothetical protein